MSKMSGARLEKDVTSEHNTFQVYLLMLKAGKASARKVAEQLGFSSSSLATHHLDKLCNLKLVSKDRYGVYKVAHKKFGILRFFIAVRKFIVPRTFFYMIFYVTMAVFMFFLLVDVARIVALFFCLIGIAANFIETMEFYRIMPKTSNLKVEQNVQKKRLI